MASCIRKSDTLSRLGGDEFVVTLEGLVQAEDAAQVALPISRLPSTYRRASSTTPAPSPTKCSVA